MRNIQMLCREILIRRSFNEPFVQVMHIAPLLTISLVWADVDIHEAVVSVASGKVFWHNELVYRTW